MQQQKDQTENEAIPEWLKPQLVPGSTVYTKVDHVSRSGMSRVISCYVVDGGEIRDISYFVSQALGWGQSDKHGGVKVGGCGMDMGFHLVYSFSRALYPKGFHCIGEGESWATNCPSPDHVNPGDRSYSPERFHTNSGYALRQRWL